MYIYLELEIHDMCEFHENMRATAAINQTRSISEREWSDKYCIACNLHAHYVELFTKFSSEPV